MKRFQQRRLQDLQRHIQADANLLRQYEEQLRLIDDPRRIERIRHEVRRQKSALDRYQKEMVALEKSLMSGARDESPAADKEESDRTGSGHSYVNISDIKDSHLQIGGDLVGRDKIVHIHQEDSQALGEIYRILDKLSRQYAGLEIRLSGGTIAILERIDGRHKATVAHLLNQMQADQLVLVDRLITAAEAQQISDTEAQELTELVEQVLAQLQTMRGDQPAAVPYQTMLAILTETSGLQQKLKLALPIIPGLLTADSEAAVDVLDTLEGAWQRLIARISP